METLPEEPLLNFPADTLNVIRKTYNLDKSGDMDRAIDILDMWVKQQHHFVIKDFSRLYLERCIIRSKGSIQRAKERLDAICTARTMLPQLFIDCNVKEFKLDSIIDAWLPNLTTDYYRVFFMRVDEAQELTQEVFLKKFIRSRHYIEYICGHDYSNGVIYVFDYTTTNLADFVKNIDLTLAGQAANLFWKSYGMRVKALHFISPSKLMSMVLTIVKQVVPKKIGERINVHKDYQQLHEYVEKDILPQEYGGNEKPLKELHEKWLDLLSSEKFIEYMKNMNAAKTNEALRRTDDFNNQYMGMPGTFRTLTVD